ncbi:MAG: hypothetical protein LBT40_10870, partial [Deltaproteobacteria bacterium]|nr:hypothetical protein [Deltaproteobacteria bacterium]
MPVLLAIPLIVLLLTLSSGPVCRADDGQDDDSDGKKGPQKHPQPWDFILKLLKEHYLHPLLELIGHDPALVKDAVSLETELPPPLPGILFADCVTRLGDGAVEIVEFQATWKPEDFGRFHNYALRESVKLWNDDEDLCPSVGVTIILLSHIMEPQESSGHVKRPRSSYPSGKFAGRGTLNFFVRLFYLNSCDGIDKILKKFRPVFERRKKEGKFS